MALAARIDSFGGMAPRTSRRLLADNFATDVANADLTSGELRGHRVPRLLHSFPAEPAYAKAYRIPDPAAPSVPVWLPLTSPTGVLVRPQLTNDAYRRYVWLDGNAPGTAVAPVYNTLARLVAGDPPYPLGVAGPTTAPGVVATGGSGATADRAYLYTYVDLYGQESQPSPPTAGSSPANATWTISGLDLPPDAATRGLVGVHLYRSVTGNGSVEYYRVNDTLITTGSYADLRSDLSLTTDDIALLSTEWAPPPPLEGLAAHPNGFLIGWAGSNLYFSEPYRPWAWPAGYTLSLKHNILACAVVEQSVVALTDGLPAVATGSSPAAITLSSWDKPVPCLAPAAVVPSTQGVFFIGPDGLMLAGPNGPSNLTAALIDERVWRSSYAPTITSMAEYRGQLLVFQRGGQGFVVDSREPRIALSRLANFNEVSALWPDPWTGEIHLMAGNQVYQWGAPTTQTMVAGWKSKEWQFPKPISIGALRVSLDSSYHNPNLGSEAVSGEVTDTGNASWADQSSLIGYALLNGAALNAGFNAGDRPPGYTADPLAPRYPDWSGVLGEISGLAIENTLALPQNTVAMFTLYANGEQVWQSEVEDMVIYRPVAGFKADRWQFSLVTRVPVLNVQLGERPKDIQDV